MKNVKYGLAASSPALYVFNANPPGAPMNSIYPKLAATVALACLSGLATTASAEILNFDDRPTGTHFFTSPYHGLTFTNTPTRPPHGSWFSSDLQPPTVYRSPNFSVSTEADLDARGNPTGLDTQSQLITSASPFRFNGAWFTSLDTGFNTNPNVLPFQPVIVTFCLYLGGVQVGIGATGLLNLGVANSPYQFLSSGYSGPIDAFTVHGLQGYFAMDDVSIPEPASYALVIAALSGLALSKRRSKR